jgi:predicted secreted Zn-dependent protease
MLTWNQFRVVTSRPGGILENAQIAARIVPPANVQVVRENGVVRLPSVTVNVSVNSANTWVLTGQQTPALLNHEQGHWDIAGLVAHELHNTLAAIRVADAAALAAEVRTVIQRFQTKVDGLQIQYDRETSHGANAAGQATWNARIQGCISGGNTPLPNPP